jgi:hypothetical protein
MILGPWLDQDTLDDVRTKLAELENEVGKVPGWGCHEGMGIWDPQKIADRLVMLFDHSGIGHKKDLTHVQMSKGQVMWELGCRILASLIQRSPYIWENN